jgi:CO/xanthine dehydrogenase Mo-binding subunit
VCSILCSILLGRPVKWIEDKSGNLISTGFARDMYLDSELALRKDGKILGVRFHADSDHGAFFSDAQPSKFKIGLLHSAFSCYDIPYGHITDQGTYTNNAPGGVAYRCSFRVTEAMFFQERIIQAAATDLGMDPAELRRINLLKDEQFPYRTPFGFLVDSGQYEKCLNIGLEAIGYKDFLREKKAALAQGRRLGIGISMMTEPLGAGNSREYDILGIKMFDAAELRVHPTGKAILKIGSKTQGQGHETTFAQIVSHELGIPADDIVVEHGDTDHTPFGMGTYASRSTPVAGAATAMVARKDPRQGKEARGAPPRGVRGGRRVGAGPLLRTGRSRAGRNHPGMRDGRVRQHAGRHGAGAREQRLLRPTEPDLALRGVNRHGRGRPSDRRLGCTPDGRRRRLRGAHQPHGRRGADHGRVDRGLRHGEHAVHDVRRRRQLRRVELHGLSPADGMGDAGLRAP